MAWYGRPAVAYAIYLPAAAAGLLLPYALLPVASPRGAKRGTSAAGRSMGTALLFALLCSGLTSIGMHSSFFWALWAFFASIAAALLGTGASGGGSTGTWGGAAALLACFVLPLGVALPSAVTFMAHGECCCLHLLLPVTLGLCLRPTVSVGSVYKLHTFTTTCCTYIYSCTRYNAIPSQ